MEITCIICPIGCRLNVTSENGEVSVQGNTCARGVKYGVQELLNPMRMVTSNVRITGGAYPLCPVKTSEQVPKAAIPKVLRAIKSVRVAAPVHVGQVLQKNIANTGIDLVATANR